MSHFEGLGAVAVVTGDVLVIERTASPERAVQDRRVIALTDIVDLHVKQPSILRSGWVQLCVRQPRPALGRAAAVRDLHTIVFSRGQRAHQSMLVRYLQKWVDYNSQRLTTVAVVPPVAVAPQRSSSFATEPTARPLSQATPRRPVTVEVSSGPSFVGFDVETANGSRGSICAVGLSVVTGGQITATYSWLCRPPSGLERFDPGNTMIHGITARDVAGEPTFRQRLGNMLDVVGDLPLIAHNAAFDIGALREASAAESLSWPPLTYGCTLLWSRRQLPELVNHKLPTVAAALGVDLLRHHDASADATAAAQIAVELIRRAGASGLDSYANATGMMLGRARMEEIRPPRDTSTTGVPTWVSIATASAPPPPNPDADPNHRLFGQTVVITGTLGHLSREEAWSQLAKYGARVNKTVTRRTSILVVGDWVDAAGRPQITEKQLHARRLHAAGQPLVFLDPYQLDAMLAGDRTIIVPDLTTLPVIDAYALADDSAINPAIRSDPRQQVRGLHYTAWRETVEQLKRDRRYDEALQLLLECIDVAERPESRFDGLPAPGWTENAAIVYRKQKNYAGEIAVLERWIAAARAGGHLIAADHSVAMRLTKAQALSAKAAKPRL